MGDFEEPFSMNLSYWETEDYLRSWRRALRILEESDTAVSCLVSSITEPETSNFVFCWPLYRQGDDVFVQNSVIFLEGSGVDADVEVPFREDAPWLSVQPHSVVATTATASPMAHRNGGDQRLCRNDGLGTGVNPLDLV